MDYVRYDPRRHRKPKALRAGWRAMRLYEALIDISAVYDLQGFITPDYANAHFIAGEVNLRPEDWGMDNEMDLALSICVCFERLVDVGMLEKDGEGFRIKGWDEFYGRKSRTEGTRVSKFKVLDSGTKTETQQKTENATPHHTTPPTPPTTVEAAFTGTHLAILWNNWAAQHKLPQVTKVGGKRKTLADARAKENPSEDYWAGVLTRISNSPGLLGKNDRGWTATFDWLVEPMSAAKVMEGKYDKWGKASGSAAVISPKQAEELYGPGAE